ncbi:MAG: aminotransferase class IV [Candidatus Omnitrophica bacterium]|nr:aminotransferase class IV [Candidatus Omnitrophota bacterium]
MNTEELVSCGLVCDSVSVFESMRAYGGVIFKLEEHLGRLFESAKSVGLSIDWPLRKLKDNLEGALHSSGRKDAFIRLSAAPGNIFIIVREPRKYRPEIYRDGVSVSVTSVLKNYSQAFMPEAKSSNFLNSIFGHLDPAASDNFEVLFLGRDGYLKEGRVSNLFIIRRGVLATPSSGILCGITRNFVLECARSLELVFSEAPFTRHNLYSADEAFLTNTSAEIVPIREADKRVIGSGAPGVWTRRLMAEFKRGVDKFRYQVHERARGRRR